MSDALTILTGAFEDQSVGHSVASDHVDPAVVISWPAVPIELVRAAGLRPVMIRGAAESTAQADHWLEPEAFPNRLRQLVDAALAGRLQQALCVVLPRTSDPDYKTFLYLRELVRRRVTPLLPPILLFDLLQSNGPEVGAYDAARARDLFETLAALRQRRPSTDDVHGAIRRTNSARSAVRRLLGLRRDEPRVSGAEVLPLLGAFWRMAPDEYAVLAHEAADVLSRRPPLNGPRVVLAGAPVDGAALHAAVESLGAIVVAEPGPWGTDAPGEDVSSEGDPFTAIAERYRRWAIGPRMPQTPVPQLVGRVTDDVDAVIVVLPPEDTVFGWDYPALRTWLDARQLPHLCVTSDPCLPLGPADREQLTALIASVTRRVGARHG
jgi:hypothetical protein